MTLDEYSEFREKLTSQYSSIARNFAKLDSRWIDRKMNKEDVVHDADVKSLKNIHSALTNMIKIIEKYIE